MLSKPIFTGILILAAFLSFNFADGEELEVSPIATRLVVLTEPTPFTVLTEGDEESGAATKYVEQILDEANMGFDIKFLPWKRAFREASIRPDTLIYPIARTSSREEQFHWVAKILPVKYFLFKLKSRKDIAPGSLIELKNYTIGVVNDHAHHEYLISQGFSKIEAVNSSEQNLKKLALGRIDLFPLSSGGLLPLCETVDFDCGQLEAAYALDEFSSGLYVAFSKDSDFEIVSTFIKAVNTKRVQSTSNRLFSKRIADTQLIESSILSQK